MKTKVTKSGFARVLSSGSDLELSDQFMGIIAATLSTQWSRASDEDDAQNIWLVLWRKRDVIRGHANPYCYCRTVIDHYFHRQHKIHLADAKKLAGYKLELLARTGTKRRGNKKQHPNGISLI